MKQAAILILFCAMAVPAALVAQTADQPLIKTKWSLKQPKQKLKQQPKQVVVGPAVPAAPKMRVRKPAPKVARQARQPRPNNKALVNAIAAGKRKNRD